MGLKLNAVAPAAGIQWMRLAFAEFFRRPMAYIGLFMAFMFMAVVASMVPVLGGLVLLTTVPLLGLGFMQAAHWGMHGQTPRLDVFVAPWRAHAPDRRRPLAVLLLLYAALMGGAMWLGHAISEGRLSEWFTARMKADTSPEDLARLAAAPGVETALLITIGVISVVSVLFWFAPALVLWAGQGIGQALFSNAFALWKARAAFLWYGLGWVGASLATVMIGGAIAALAGPVPATLLLVPANLALTCAFYVSVYFSYRDCFGSPADTAAQ